MKTKIKKIIFQLGLAPLSEKLNFLKEKLKNRKENKLFKKENPDIILPPDFYIYETFTLDYKKYYEGGKKTAQWLSDHLKEFISTEKKSVLDWGCGPGRIMRHLPEVLGESNNYFGCDYNRKYVYWCSNIIENVTFKKNELAPPLDFENESLDIVYGISIFTHLSEKMHHSWIKELNRVLKKKGILFLTTHGEVSKIKLSRKEREQFSRNELVINEYKKEGNRLLHHTNLTYFSNICVRRII